MPNIGTGDPLLTPTAAEPWPGCGVPPVLFGTGELFIVNNSTGLEETVGNVTTFNVGEDAEPFEFFEAGSDELSIGSTTREWRLGVVGDYFSYTNLARIFNATPAAYAGGFAALLETVRELELFRVIFRKDVVLTDSCNNQRCGTLELELWRTYFEAGGAFSGVRAQPNLLEFNLVALPDLVTHPAAPFGSVRLICPIAEAS